MHSAILLVLTCCAVSNAAFSINLVKDTQPLVANSIFNLRLAAQSNALKLSAFDDFIAHIEAHVNSLIAQAQEAALNAHEVAQNLHAELLAAAQALQAIGTQSAHDALAAINALLANLQSSLGGNKHSLQDLVAAIQQAHAHIQQQLAALDLHALLVEAINAILPAHLAQIVIAHLDSNNKGVIGDHLSSVAQQLAEHLQQVLAAGSSAFANLQAHIQQLLLNANAQLISLNAEIAQQILDHLQGHLAGAGGQEQQVVRDLNIIRNLAHI